MLAIPTPEEAYSSVKVALNGVSYTFEYNFNFYSNMWFLDIYLNDSPVILNQALLNQTIISYRQHMKNLDHGYLTIGCRENYIKQDVVGFRELGIGKPFTLFYVSNEEVD